MYVVQSSLQTDSPIMLINQHIGYDADDGMGCSGPEFQRELLELDGAGYKRIQIWINSPGGVVMDAYAIYNAILKTRTPVDTYCVGMAASSAAIIFQAGRKRTMADYGRLMFHNPSGGDDKKAIDSIRGSIVTMISRRSGKTPEEIGAMMDRTSWITPEEALEAGLCDFIEQSNEHNMKYVKDFWKTANAVINSILKIENMEGAQVQAKVSLSLIANYLGLNSEATENSILTEVKNRINSETLAKENALQEVKNLNDKLTAAKEEANAIQKKYDDKVQELKAVTDKIASEKAEADRKVKEAEIAAATVKAEKMVKDHAALGRIKNESIDGWVKKAVEDFDGVDALLKDLPVNRKAATAISNTVKPENINAVDPQTTPMSAVALMAKVQNKHLKN